MGKVMSLVQSPDPMGESQNWQHTLAISAQGRQRWVDPWVPLANQYGSSRPMTDSLKKMCISFWGRASEVVLWPPHV